VFDLASDSGRAAIDATTFPVFVLGEHGQVLDANAAACAYFGQSRAEFSGVDALGVRGYSPTRRGLFGKRFAAWLAGEISPFLVAWPPRTGSDKFLVLPQRTIYAGKPAVSTTLVPAPVVEAALAGHSSESTRRMRAWVKQQSRGTTPPRGDALLEQLTPREWEIARRLAEGDRVPLIVEDLGIAENTVRNHLKSIFRKLQVGSQAELVRHLKRRA
jgi:DNA-binding CsgD family transcriptional regulator